MSTPDEAREELSAIVLDHFHSPDALHSTWWIRPAETADAILAAGYRKQGPVTEAQVEAALLTFWHAIDVDPVIDPTDFADMRAALEAARKITNGNEEHHD